MIGMITVLIVIKLQNILSPMGNGPETPMCLLPSQHTGGISPEQMSMISRFAVASVGSQGTVGGLLFAGIVSVKYE